MAGCDHISEIDPTMQPRVEGVCEECVKEGSAWVSLRVCKTCGHVGCCDSSPKRHARAHYEATGHPVMGPAEGGQDWMWCFVDNTYVEI